MNTINHITLCKELSIPFFFGHMRYWKTMLVTKFFIAKQKKEKKEKECLQISSTHFCQFEKQLINSTFFSGCKNLRGGNNIKQTQLYRCLYFWCEFNWLICYIQVFLADHTELLKIKHYYLDVFCCCWKSREKYLTETDERLSIYLSVYLLGNYYLLLWEFLTPVFLRGLWVTASHKSPGLFSVFWPFSIMQ